MRTQYEKPPQLAVWLLSRVCDKAIRYSVLGDFEEQFQFIATERSVSSAIVWYWLQVIRSIPLFTIDSIYWSIVMFKNYLKLAFRNLVKNKMASIINLTGLSVAIGCTLVAYAVFDYHYNRDSFHTNSQKIFMVKNVISSNKGEQIWGNAPLPLGPALKRDFPQVKRAIRWSGGSAAVRHREHVFQERVQFVGEDFLQMFTFPMIFGDKAALSDRNAVVLSEEFAIKYFGYANPVGNELLFTFSNKQKNTFVVKGVTEKIPRNSSIRFDILIPYEAQPDLKSQDYNDWSLLTSATFIDLYENQSIETVANETQRYIELQNSASPDRKMAALLFEPLSNVSENSYRTRASITGSGVVPAQIIGIFFDGLFLLLLACFNYMNISVVSASRRLKEIGIRKVMGGRRSELIKQFLGENIVLCLMASIVGLVLGQYFLVPGFDSLFLGSGSIGIDLFGDTQLWLFMGTMLLLISLGSGAYPAFYISSFQPVNIFRDKVKISGNNRFTQILLTLQFVFSFVLIILCTIFIQNNAYQRDRDWGYQQDQVFVFHLDGETQFQELKNTVSQHPNVLNTAGAAIHIGQSTRRRGIEILDNRYDVAAFDIGYDYIEAMGLQLLAGRSFDRTMSTDFEQSVIVNKSFIEMMQWNEKPIGRRFQQGGTELTVIGVVEDFHYQPIGIFKVEPVVLKLTEESAFRYLVVALKPGTTVQTSNDLQQTWRTLYPDMPYNGYFQDSIWDNYMQILTGIDKSSIFLSFVVLLLTCMGIFGLVSMSIAIRLKEISIRKVLGASVMSIINLVSKRFLVLFAIASLLAVPGSYFLAKMMLDGIFIDHQNLDVWPFIAAFLIVLAATLSTITSQLYKAVKINPVDALRYE